MVAETVPRVPLSLLDRFPAGGDNLKIKGKHKLCLAALVFALAAGTAEAGKKTGGGGGGGKGGGGGGGGVETNYGCGYLPAGTIVSSGGVSKSLTTTTYACYICNMTTRVCTLQSPASLLGWTYVRP